MYFNTDQEFQAMNSDRDLLEALTIMKETYQKYLKLQIYHPGDQIQLSFP
jgi:guanylate kinase